MPVHTQRHDINSEQGRSVVVTSSRESRRRSLQFCPPFCFPLRARGAEIIGCLWVYLDSDKDRFLQREETIFDDNIQVKIVFLNMLLDCIFWSKAEHSRFSAIVLKDKKHTVLRTMIYVWNIGYIIISIVKLGFIRKIDEKFHNFWKVLITRIIDDVNWTETSSQIQLSLSISLDEFPLILSYVYPIANCMFLVDITIMHHQIVINIGCFQTMLDKTLHLNSWVCLRWMEQMTWCNVTMNVILSYILIKLFRHNKLELKSVNFYSKLMT